MRTEEIYLFYNQTTNFSPRPHFVDVFMFSWTEISRASSCLHLFSVRENLWNFIVGL